MDLNPHYITRTNNLIDTIYYLYFKLQVIFKQSNVPIQLSLMVNEQQLKNDKDENG